MIPDLGQFTAQFDEPALELGLFEKEPHIRGPGLDVSPSASHVAYRMSFPLSAIACNIAGL